MAKTLLDLAASLEKRAKQLDAVASKLAVEAAKAIVADLSEKTPVDTSNALSNWIVTLGQPSSNTIKPYFPGIYGSTKRSSAAQTRNEAEFVLGAKKPGQSIFITNNVDYIVGLNEGSSKQQPAGFVERAVMIGRAKILKFKLKG